MRVLYYDANGKTFDGLLIKSYGPTAEETGKKGKVTEEAKPERADIVIVVEAGDDDPPMSLTADRLGIAKVEPKADKPDEVSVTSVEAVPVVLLREVPRRDEAHPVESFKIVV